MKKIIIDYLDMSKPMNSGHDGILQIKNIVYKFEIKSARIWGFDPNKEKYKCSILC